MAYPSGTGTEFVYGGTMHAQSNDPTSFRWDTTLPTVGTETDAVPSLHVITVLTITFCEMGNAAETLTLYQNDGANWIYVFYAYTMAAYDTLTWNERFCLVPADKLIINCGGTTNIDVTYSFIDQDWT